MPVYILQLDEPLGNENHKAYYYVGYCNPGRLSKRVGFHAKGMGASFTRAAVEKGIKFRVIYYDPDGTRDEERRIKNMKNTEKFLVAQRNRGCEFVNPEWIPVKEGRQYE